MAIKNILEEQPVDTDTTPQLIKDLGKVKDVVQGTAIGLGSMYINPAKAALEYATGIKSKETFPEFGEAARGLFTGDAGKIPVGNKAPTGGGVPTTTTKAAPTQQPTSTVTPEVKPVVGTTLTPKDVADFGRGGGTVTNDMMKAYGTSAPADGSIFTKLGLPEYKPYESKQAIAPPPSEAPSTGALHESLKVNLEKVMGKMDDIRSTMFMRSHMKKSERAFWGNAMAAYSQMANQLTNSLAEIEKGRTGLPMEGYKAQNLATNEAEKTGIEGRKVTGAEYGLPFEIQNKMSESAKNKSLGGLYEAQAKEWRPGTKEEAYGYEASKHTKTEVTEAEKAYYKDYPTRDKFGNDKSFKDAVLQHNSRFASDYAKDKSGNIIYKTPSGWVDKDGNRVTR